MKLSVLDFINKTEKNDFKVYAIHLDPKNDKLQISIEGTYWFKEKNAKPIIMENGGSIIAKSYISFEARYFSPQDKLWRTLDYENIELFDEINVKSYQNKILTLAGNGRKSGYWIEYLIDGGEIEIQRNE